VAPGEPVVLLEGGPRYVSRGGEKLAAALEGFGIDVSGARALDAGASTGGFTDCLLQHGASTVTAVDVGRGQLHEHLRQDGRVTVVEKTNVRDVSPGSVGGRFDVVTADLSFISLRTVAGQLVDLVRPGGDLIVLVKPQFEVGRREAAKGKGVVREPDLWQRVLEEVIAAFQHGGATMMGVMVSPLRGAEGNAEFLAHFRIVAEPVLVAEPVVVAEPEVATEVARAVAAAAAAVSEARP
jgi:23S rRNA (cytidine1920-2'-O)/16S rRNA (cytidine1409-2'-O)-methyltransferase